MKKQYTILLIGLITVVFLQSLTSQTVFRGNILDEATKSQLAALHDEDSKILLISAKNKLGIDNLKNSLLEMSNTGELGKNDFIVSNNRHFDSLIRALETIQKVKAAMSDGVSGDLMAIDIREALFHLGEITGSVTTDDLLGNIFSNFCIGK